MRRYFGETLQVSDGAYLTLVLSLPITHLQNLSRNQLQERKCQHHECALNHQSPQLFRSIAAKSTVS